MSEGRAKVVSAVPVGIPREAVVGTVERQTELAGGMKWVGGKVIREVVKAEREGSGRHGRMTLRVSLAWGRRRSQRSSGKSGWVDAKVEMTWFLAVLTDFRSFSSILAFFTVHSLPLPSLICDNETSLECRNYFLLQRLPVQFVPPQMHRSNPAEKSYIVRGVFRVLGGS